MYYGDNEYRGGIMFPLIILVAIVFWCCFAAQQEAKTYNKLTGENVSMWDALFVELRIEGKVEEKNE